MIYFFKSGEWRVQCCSTGGYKALKLKCLRLVIFLLGRVKAIADYVSSSLRFTAVTFSRSAGLRRFQDTVPRVWWVRSGEGGGVELFETADLRSGGVHHGTRTF